MTAAEIIREVAASHGLTVAQVTGKSRARKAVAARIDIAVRLKAERSMTWGQIALRFGCHRQNMRYYLNPDFRAREVARANRRHAQKRVAREYDAAKDFCGSINACYAAVRARVAAGGPSWEAL